MKERDNIVAEVAASLSAAHATELSKLQQEHEDALASRMTSQKASLDRAYARDVDQRVERERGRRLSQLEETRQALIFLQDRVRESTLASADALSLTRISRALHALEKVATREGVPFADELDILRRSIPSSSDGPGKADVMYAVLDTMNPLIAHTGLPTAESLTRRFVDVSKEIRRTILVPENGGFFAHLVSRVLSPLLLLTSSTGDGKGRNDPETILARAEEYMLPVNGNGVDVEMAARELNQLDGWHRQIARDWIEEVRKWAEMRQALEVLESEAFLRSLQHE
ncbi:MAG: mitochondrial inner membrane protein Mitofilin [Piptocephalis tieghemiana]|nr:MAG: mitochondrial inner membrane protein Mitofilin [Piptocephalis tieghemiana]